MLPSCLYPLVILLTLELRLQLVHEHAHHRLQGILEVQLVLDRQLLPRLVELVNFLPSCGTLGSLCLRLGSPPLPPRTG